MQCERSQCVCKAFFDELHIIFMAAPSVGRRSCTGQREAAALISQSRRFHRRVKGLLDDGFFLLPSSGRMLFNIQFNVSSKVLTLNADIISTIRKCNCVTISSGCFNQSDCFIRSRNPKYFCSTFRNLQSAVNRQLLTGFSFYGSSSEHILCI